MGFDEKILDRSTESVRTLYRYWKTVCGGRPMPRRRDFDPIDVPQHLPGILLIDVEPPDGNGRPVFRYRVVGGWEVDARGHNPTGKTVDEGYHGASLAAARRDYEQVAGSGQPLYEPLEFVDRRGVKFNQESIILPLSEDGSAVSQILVYSEPQNREQRTGP